MRLRIESFYLFLFAVSVVFINYTSAARSSHGEECTRTQKCDRLAWLSCQEGKCDCSKPEEMLYDEERKTCVIKSGERCKYGVEEGGETSLVEIIDCVTHANCSSAGLCDCDSRYYETFNGTCGLSFTIGENCSDGKECSKYEKLTCMNGQCECKVNEAQYSEKEGHCVGLVQNDCIYGKCVEGAVCDNETCRCSSNYFASPDNICFPKKEIFQNCTHDVECLHNGLLKPQCIAGICDCPAKSKYSKVQKYEYNSGRIFFDRGSYSYEVLGFRGPRVETCAPIIGEYCPDGYCIENAFCEIPKRRSKHKGWIYSAAKCICSGDLHASWNRTRCAKIYRESCKSESDCTDDFVCSNEKCDCPSPQYQYFNATTKTCVTKIGGHCAKDSACIENSHCEFTSTEATGGHCRCNEKFVMNKQRTCDRSYGEDCSIKTPECDKAAGLVCLNNKCSCPDIMYSYSQTFRMCLGLVGANCDSFQDTFAKTQKNNSTLTTAKLPCVSNAYCSKAHIFLPADCKCMDGYEETDNHTCRYILDKTDEPSSVNQENHTDPRNYSSRGIGSPFKLLIRSKATAHSSFNKNERNLGNISAVDSGLQCNSSEFRCAKSDHCEPLVSRCDGKKDCSDGSDEEFCDNYCSESNMFRCRNGKCIMTKWVCDGIVQYAIDDDGDSSDEKNCGSIITTSTTSQEYQCPNSDVYGWECLSGECTFESFKCDIYCSVWPDERIGCENTYWCDRSFRCSNGECVASNRRVSVCDGVYNCHNYYTSGPDEIVCSLE